MNVRLILSDQIIAVLTLC